MNKYSSYALFLILRFAFIICYDYEILQQNIGSNNYDVVAAFCDYNADKHIDILVISNFGMQVDVIQTGEASTENTRLNIIKINNTEKGFISGVVPVDFNGDGSMDVLINLKNAQKEISLIVYWGHKNTNEVLDTYYTFQGLFKDEPILFDYNTDMLPDLLTEALNGEKQVWQSYPSNNSFLLFAFPITTPLSLPHSAAFVNIANGTNTDLILQVTGNIFLVFSDNMYEKPYLTYTYTPGTSDVVLLSSFADFNQDGKIDHIIPVSSTAGDSIKVYFQESWLTLYTLNAGTKFKEKNILELSATAVLEIPFSFHVGDFNQDGFSDLLAVLEVDGGKMQPVLFENVECFESECSAFKRQFKIRPLSLPHIADAIYLATFFDLHENGNLDIILTAGVKNETSKYIIPYTVALKNILSDDTCFIKVTVASGLCDEQCLNGKRPHGVNNPGPTITYQTMNAKGDVQISTGTQISQTSHFALQLPFVIFGLGRTPNFVDTVDIYIPQPHNSQQNRNRQWTQIIPNSQLLVNPYTPNNPLMWKLYLFVMPSKQIYITAAVLGSTCLGLATLVGGLLWLEKKEDKEEKKQDSQKFHFDAM